MYASDRREFMQIGAFARQAGVSIRTVRYYEELALLSPEKRSRGGFRLYGPENKRRLSVISFLKDAGLPLTEIRRIFLAKRDSGSDQEAVKLLLRVFGEKLRLVESKIDSLRVMKNELMKTLDILRSCEQCGREVLLEASSCRGCEDLGPEKNVPDTLWVLLH
jgi:DNA-binding transcriptional MerR regulator